MLKKYFNHKENVGIKQVGYKRSVFMILISSVVKDNFNASRRVFKELESKNNDLKIQSCIFK